MKRSRICILLLVFLLTANVALAASNTTRVSTQDGEKLPLPILDVVCWQDECYLADVDTLYRLDATSMSVEELPFQEKKLLIPEITDELLAHYGPDDMEYARSGIENDMEKIHRVVSDRERLWALNSDTGALYEIVMENGQPQLLGRFLLDILCPEEGQYWPIVSEVAAVGNQLLVDVQYSLKKPDLSYVWSGQEKNFLFSYNLTDGTRTVVDNEALLKAINPKHGWSSILPCDVQRVVVCTYNDRYESMDVSLSLYNAAEDTLEPWAGGVISTTDWSIDVMAIEPETQTVYIQENGLIYAMETDGKRTLVGAVAKDTRSVAMMNREQLVTLGFGELWVHRVTEPVDISTLSVMGEEGAGRLLTMCGQYQLENQNIAIFPSKPYRHTIHECFVLDMSSRSSSEDVYELPIGTEINQIIGQKGYSAAIQIDPSFAERLLPHIREQCVDNGKLIALPLTLTQQTFAYNPEVAQRLGVADIPTTWEELTRFIFDCQEPYAVHAEKEGVYLFASSPKQARTALVLRLYKEYVAYCLTHETLPDGLQESVIAMLETFDRVEALYDAPAQELQFGAAEALFTLNGSFLPGERSSNPGLGQQSAFTPALLALVPGEPPQFVLSGYAAVLNPYGEKQRQATQLLAYISERLSAADGSALFADAAPAEADDYRSSVAQEQLALDRLAEQSKAADEAEQRELESQRQAVLARMERLEEKRWLVTQEHLDDYHRALEQSQVVWLQSSPLMGADDQLWSQYWGGGLTPAQFVEKLTHIISMMNAETVE